MATQTNNSATGNTNQGTLTIGSRGVPSSIQPFVPDDFNRTLLQAHVANELVRALNALLNMKGANGITIYRSDSNFVISLADPNIDNGSTTNINNNNTTDSGSAASSSIQWKGQWTGSVGYVKGDIVRRTLPIDYENGDCVGTYICIQDAPIGTDAPTMNDDPGTYWDLFAPFACQNFVQVNGSYKTKMAVIDGTYPAGFFQVQKGVGLSDPYVLVDVDRANGKQIDLREEVICENGTAKNKIVLDSDSY